MWTQSSTHFHNGVDTSMEKSKTFCSAVWSNVHITPAGAFTPCCAWPNTVEFDRQSVKEQMLRGETVSGCAVCNTHDGLRQWFNQKLPATGTITSVDLSIDNVCNYECLMCSSEYSNRCSRREIRYLGYSVTGERILSNENYRLIDWTQVERVKFFGGEPLISPGLREFVDWVDVDWSTIAVEINTNNSVSVPDYLANIFRSCASLHVTVSRDGLDTVNQYQRPGAPTLLEETPRFTWWTNLYYSRPAVSLNINSAVGIYNALDQKPMQTWFAENYPEWQIHYEMIQSPEWQNLSCMPQELKALYAPHIHNHAILDHMWKPADDRFQEFLQYHSWVHNEYGAELGSVNSILDQYQERHATS